MKYNQSLERIEVLPTLQARFQYIKKTRTGFTNALMSSFTKTRVKGRHPPLLPPLPENVLIPHVDTTLKTISPALVVHGVLQSTQHLRKGDRDDFPHHPVQPVEGGSVRTPPCHSSLVICRIKSHLSQVLLHRDGARHDGIHNLVGRGSLEDLFPNSKGHT